MAQAILDTSVNDPVYLGVWTNWSLGGRFTGSVITVTHRNGALLTAFLAIFVTFTGSRLWRIACFALHQWLMAKSNLPQDGLYHQRQAILRNASDGTSGSIQLLKSLWAWRLRAKQPLHRMVPTIVFSVSMTAALAVASLFSSKISSAMGNEVLISSSHCGLPGWIPGRSLDPNPSAENYDNIYNPWVAQRINSYANYVQRCYLNNSTLDTCLPFIRKRLPSHVNRNADCPFQEEICRHQKGNIKLDTGYLNSQNDLGVKSPMDLRFNLRIVTHCAPITTQTHQRTIEYSQDKLYMQYYLGEQTTLGSEHVQFQMPNYTYEAEKQDFRELQWRANSTSLADYSINAKVCKIYNKTIQATESSFIPIPELVSNDGDLLLIFLSANDFRYSAPVDDDWYAAHQRGNGNTSWVLIGNTSTEVPYYLADEPASVLGCQLSYQVCDPTLPPDQGCSPLGGEMDANFGFTEPRTRRERAIYWVFDTFYMFDIIRTLKTSALTSRYRLFGAPQTPPAVNQWQLEVENWHNIGLAIFQGLRVDSATGPGDSGMLQHFWAPPRNAEEKYLCKNQKIISTAYTNFSMLWLVIVLVIGLSIILIELFLEYVVVFLDGHGILKLPSLEWFSNHTFQLQRMAHEELGLGGIWDDCTGPGAIPVTDKGKVLAVLDGSDPKHPILVNAFKQSKLAKQDNDNSDTGMTSGAEGSASGNRNTQVGQSASDSESVTATEESTADRERVETNVSIGHEEGHLQHDRLLTDEGNNNTEERAETVPSLVDLRRHSRCGSRNSGTDTTEMGPDSNSTRAQPATTDSHAKAQTVRTPEQP